MANAYAADVLACPSPPGLLAKTVGKMGLKGVPGLVIVEEDQLGKPPAGASGRGAQGPRAAAASPAKASSGREAQSPRASAARPAEAAPAAGPSFVARAIASPAGEEQRNSAAAAEGPRAAGPRRGQQGSEVGVRRARVSGVGEAGPSAAGRKGRPAGVNQRGGAR